MPGDRTPSRVQLGAGVVALGFLLAACGGSSTKAAQITSSQAPTTTSTSTAPSSAASAPAGASSSAAAAPPAAAPNLGGGSFCDKAKAAEAASAASGASLANGSAASLQKLEEQALTELQAFVSSAPAAIKGDVQTLATADQSLFNSLKAANFDYSKVSPSALAGFATPAVTNASKTIEAYLSTNCGITEPNASSSP